MQMLQRPAFHIVQGSPDSHLRILKRAVSGTGRLAAWTVPKSAKPGDRVFFYIVRPVSSFVGSGVVAGHPSRNQDPQDPWFGHFTAPMRNVVLLPQPVRLDQVRRALPDWGYLRNVRVGATIPVALSAPFENALNFVDNGLTNHLAELSDLEGTQTEMKLMVRSRSRRLRDAALESSGGICAVCECDFSRLLAGRGVRVLQVHHLKQLSATGRPAVTSLKDLAVVCSNCHLLIHLDAKRALSVVELKRMLAHSPSSSRE
jgi:hypothetical protein